MLEWLIIGGGVQGSFLSHVLTGRFGLGTEQVRVLDPHPDPLTRWHDTTGNCGMLFLRSPAAHHIGLRTNELLDFARERHQDWRQRFLQPYLRPSLALWNEHARHVIESNRLAQMRTDGTALRIERHGDGFTVGTPRGELSTRCLILAPGNSQPLHYPELAGGIPDDDRRVLHVFDPRFERGRIADGEDVAIIGSGVTAAQLALALSGRSGSLHVLTDRAPQISWFDSDPGWNGPRLLDRLADIGNPDQRLATVSAARIKGSFPGDTAALLLAAQLRGQLLFHPSAVQAIDNSSASLRLACADGSAISVDRVVFATGFSTLPPALPLVRDTSARLGLPLAAEGWPVVDAACEWGENLYVCGALAQLTLGPVSRNISGVRSFARRLAQRLEVASPAG